MKRDKRKKKAKMLLKRYKFNAPTWQGGRSDKGQKGETEVEKELEREKEKGAKLSGGHRLSW